MIVILMVTILSCLDDLFIDLVYWTRRSRGQYQHHPVDIPMVEHMPEQRFAIIIPAWQEANVIAKMVNQTISTLRYDNYDIFIGTYPNDHATSAEVAALAARFPHVHQAFVTHAGPTCKADCLNTIIMAVLRHEAHQACTYAGFIQHDCEDILHPLELKIFNASLAGHDMIQLPVRPLPRKWHDFTSGTYMDEFAEWHSKDLLVRQTLCGSIPSAGVGTCFSRKAITALMSSRGVPFHTATLTEDYDIGTRLAAQGLRTTFLLTDVPYPCHGKADTQQLPLCVQEYFPDTLGTACKQKARWLVGIAFQGWQQLGWQGSLGQRYMFMRDRKTIVTSLINVTALLLSLQFAGLHLARAMQWSSLALPAFLSNSHWLIQTSLAVMLVMLCRTCQRSWFVARLYGKRQACLSVMRIIPGSVLNTLAALRAWFLFLRACRTGKPIAWDKTHHDYPSSGQLADMHVSRHTN